MDNQQADDEAVHKEPLLTVEEAAKRLHISRSLVYKLIHEGQLRPVYLGNAVRLRPEDVEALRNSIADGTMDKRHKKRKKREKS
jgi:excisionase family DNA binding protein